MSFCQLPVESVARAAAVSRADLLRGLAYADLAALALEHSSDHWWGYLRRETMQVKPGPQQIPAGSRHARQQPPTLAGLVQQYPAMWMVTQERPLLGDAHEQSQPLPVGTPLTEAEAKAEAPGCRVQHKDLLPWARLLPVMLKPLRTQQVRGLDVPAWVQQWALRERNKPWPRLTVPRLPQPLIVVLDFAERLWPYFEDMHRLCARLLATCGAQGLSLRALVNGPESGWTDWLVNQNPNRVEVPDPQAWQMPVAGSAVLLVSDLGVYGRNESEQQAWSSFVVRLKHARIKPLALSPVSAGQMTQPVFSQLQALRWSPDAMMRYSGIQGGQTSWPDAVETSNAYEVNGLTDLLAMIAVSRRVDPPLLRALRALNPGNPLDAGLEAAAWNHPDVDGGSNTACTLLAKARQHYQAHFNGTLTEHHVAVGRVRQSHHAHLRSGVNHEETLLWAAAASVQAQQMPDMADRIAQARRFCANLVATMHTGANASQTWIQQARQWLWRADAALVSAHADVFYTLAAAVFNPQIEQSGTARLPHWVDIATLARFSDQGTLPQQASQPYWLVHDATVDQMLLQPYSPQRNQGLVHGPVAMGRITIQRGPAQPVHAHELHGQTLYFGPANDIHNGPWLVRTESTELKLAPVRRPHWLESWGRDKGGIAAFVQNPWGTAVQVYMPRPVPESSGQLDFIIEPPSQGKKRLDSVGLYLDEYGPLATMTVGHTNQMQAFRFLPPGHFLMGSTDKKIGRSYDEGPRHWVTLINSLWLADTACSQGLWQAVMGSNPSRFKGSPDLPVENVSWDDVQQFLQKLQVYLPPGLEAVLPTEVEWEYACRAGTTSASSFDDTITPDPAHYEWNHPYRNTPKGENRRKTIPVKSLPANPWGLHQMHGNVWEWCADDLRSYTADAVSSPHGLKGTRKEARFTVRGGSWSGSAQLARSARRGRDERDWRNNILGFRFALRSKEQEAEGPVLRMRSVQLSAGAALQASTPAKSRRKKSR